MRNPGKQGRLKYTRGPAFACGMFGVCVHDVLSPRSPPALQERIIKASFALSEGNLPLEQESCLLRISPKSADQEMATGDGKGGQVADTVPERQQEAQMEGTVIYGARPESPSNAAMVLEGFMDSQRPPGCVQSLEPAVAPQDGASGAADSPFHYDVLLGPETASSSKQSDVQFIDALLREIAGGKPSETALSSLLQLAKESESYRNQMLAAKIVPNLLSLFAAGEVERGGAVLVEAFSLIALFASDVDVRLLLADPQFLLVVSYYLHRGSANSRLDAAYMLEKVSVVDGLKQAVGESAMMMEGLVRLICERSRLWSDDKDACAGYNGSHQARQRKLLKSVTTTLLALSLEKENRVRAVEAGAVSALLEMLPEARAVAAERTLATLELLATTAEGRRALIGHALGVPILVGMILKVSNLGTEYAAGALCAMCCTGDTHVQEAAIQAGAATQLLLLIQSDCTPRARRKAMQLLKILHKLWEESPCNPDSFLARSNAFVL